MVLTTDVSPDVAGLRSIAARVGPIRETNYGVEWEIRAVTDPPTLVDADVHLRVHADLPYRDAPPGIQLLLSVEADAVGGETLLIDGYRVAEELRQVDPESWALLTITERSFAYGTDDHLYVGGGPMIGLRRDGSYGILRHAPDLILPLRAEPAQVAAVDRATERFMELAADPAFELRHRLSPGEVLTFNNHRVLHGRSRLDLGTGERRLLGCYCELDDLRSARRVRRRAIA